MNSCFGREGFERSIIYRSFVIFFWLAGLDCNYKKIHKTLNCLSWFLFLRSKVPSSCGWVRATTIPALERLCRAGLSGYPTALGKGSCGGRVSLGPAELNLAGWWWNRQQLRFGNIPTSQPWLASDPEETSAS